LFRLSFAVFLGHRPLIFRSVVAALAAKVATVLLAGHSGHTYGEGIGDNSE